ncbi:hypothetical protein PPERSA_05384 [Pseudocohnilembus persalinus]|uniref:Histidine phosphatase superfamily, clade-2 n=1 Tax=Pseudocohnilembus persalinus TaxID=266149 RepID=A0A0V0R7U9_PSEPJ|nr:hypothetical protein PPERSA_05384 [Pseudocohnilembus persalinus]|eukprot:KRX10564.1 hypothetical protein PPERSA_05384 [Pseudocohnilembus persalinus]
MIKKELKEQVQLIIIQIKHIKKIGKKKQNSMNFSLQLIAILSAFIGFIQVQAELIFVNQLYRHGARGTIVDNYYDSELQIHTKEELTATGMRQHYNLGSQLRKEYIDELGFLDEKINWNQILVTCTDFNRTLQSAYSQLYGLYPPGTGTTIDMLVDGEDMLPPFKGAQQPKGLQEREALPNKFQPIPVHVNTTVLSWPPEYCANYGEIQQSYYKKENKEWFDYINGNYSDTFESLKTLIEYDGEIDFDNIEDVWDILVADLNNARPLPLGMNANIWQNLTELDTFYWFFQQNGSFEAAQLQNTDLFQQWRTNLQLAKDGKTNGLKWAMYSAHDSNVAGAMAGLNLTSWECLIDEWWYNKYNDQINCNQRPYFAASIIMELHNNDGNYQVAVKYDGRYQYLCEKTDIYCDFDEFIERMSNQILDQEQVNNYCNSDNWEFYVDQNKQQDNKLAQYLRDNSGGNKFIFFLQIFSLGLSAFVVYFLIKYKNSKAQYTYLCEKNNNNEPSQSITEKTQFEVENQ